MPEFIPGLVLAERFYQEAVRPILDAKFPGLTHAAGLIGGGSEVLGFDTPVSADHHWGPRAMLFLADSDHAKHAEAIRGELSRSLPHEFLGWPTNFADPDPADPGTRLLRATTHGPIHHRVDVLAPRDFFTDYLGHSLEQPLDALDWLTIPAQKLRSIVAGGLFHDGLGIEAVRRRLVWYPHDVWLYQLAAGWKRLRQEEHLMGRAGQVGDEIGSALIGSRLVRDVMRLCFLMERQYAPYPKWFGTAFARLKAAPALSPLLNRVLQAEAWPERDRALGEAYTVIARKSNELGLTEPLQESTQPFYGRPFTVLFAERFADALRARIEDPALRRMSLLIGGIDLWSDSTDLLAASSLRARLRELYRDPS